MDPRVDEQVVIEQMQEEEADSVEEEQPAPAVDADGEEHRPG